MALECVFEMAPDHVICIVSGQFTAEEGVRVIQSTVDACILKDLSHALIDSTGIEHAAMATNKIVTAHKVEELFNRLSEVGQKVPRIAIFGFAPFIDRYKPASDYFQLRNLPIRTFDSRSAAMKWLFATDPN